MDELIRAIINTHLFQVRALAKTKPKLLKQLTPTGQSPLELAKAKGHKRIETAIARAVDVHAYYSATELQQLLVDYIAEMSEEYYASGWNDSIECELWALLVGDDLEGDLQRRWTRHIDPEELVDLRFLVEHTQSWAMWNDNQQNAPDANKVLILELPDWLPIYTTWLAKHLNKQS
ncbi:hypothetical protein SAMN06265337_4132 [Hymenobacter gelipurpurascens]|uniref:Uncharacterized protein n=1 Tax=Hymenobacter gelipurpurascens TaxID=89968 RepID=A0A212UHJ4_9BACT|nr:hypothetical protein [Hymenobacter gelipurpurascens]SNC77544.1 hypothetical protein SAMN06265337_4132 [Hymenobacter gelipurpurascens]